jgi:hypothetical protein
MDRGVTACVYFRGNEKKTVKKFIILNIPTVVLLLRFFKVSNAL